VRNFLISAFVVLASVAALGFLAVRLINNQPVEETPSTDPTLTTSGSSSTANETVQYALEKEEREYLWNLEHHSNLLNKFGFQPFIDAWRNQDRTALLALLDDNFQATMIQLQESQTLAAKTELINVTRHESTSAPSVDSSGEVFVDWLLEIRHRFADDPAPKGRFDVMTLAPPESDQPAELWTAMCLHRLWGQSKSGGPFEVVLKLKIVAHDLTKERLAEPGWLYSCEVQQVEVAHAKQPLFQEVTDDSGIDPKSFHDNWKDTPEALNTGGVYACDFNRDGLIDLFITDPNGNRFYIGHVDGRFEHATLTVGLRTAQKDTIAAFADLDNDGWVDLVLPRTGRIFRNEKGQRFREVTNLSNLGALIQALAAPAESIAGIVPGDFNRDGLIDLYVTRATPPTGSWLESKQPGMVANQLLQNQGNWSFFDATERTKTGGGGRSCFAAVWTDINNDRWPDLYMINEFGNGALFVNHEGRYFEERELIADQNDFGSMGLSCGDINNDGNIDIYVSNMYSKAGSRIMGNMKAESYPEEVKKRLRHMVAGGELYTNDGDLGFKPVGKDFQVHAAGWAWGSSLADLDNDGWLDLHVTAGFMSRDRNKPDG
jgi:hypothetical protein